MNVSGFAFDLFGQPVIVHFGIGSSIPVHSQYLSSLFSWICSDWRLFVMIARSFAYVAEFIINLDVPNVYPFSLFYSQRNNSSRKIKNRYGLSMSPCIVPLCMGVGFGFLKCSPINMVLEYEYILPSRVTASFGYLRSFIMARSLAWSRSQMHFKNLYIINICLSL